MKIKLKNFLNEILLLFLTCSVYSQQFVELANEFIKIKYNKSTFRFRMYTTGGIPEIETDNNSNMLFSTLVAEEETTFAAVKIDNNEYVFGKNYNQVIANGDKKDNSIESVLEYDNNIVVYQTLSFVKGKTTGNMDTLKIEYKIENKDSKSHNVEVKLTLDTYLGNNDGAPFSIPSVGIITTDKMFSDANIPDFWYALDNIQEPSISAIGVLKVDGYPLPKKVLFTNWPNLYYSKQWIPKLEEGRKFKSSIITGTDSACAIYCGPMTISAGETYKCCFLYGIYGITLQSAELFDIAVAVPKKVKQGSNFVVTCDIQNKTEFPMDTLEVELILPEEIINVEPEKEPLKKNVKNLPSKEITKFYWTLQGKQKKDDLFKKSKIIFSVNGKIILPNNKVQQSSSSIEKEVIIIPLIDIEERNKNIKLLTEQIQQVNHQVNEIDTKLSASTTKKYK
jgi:hypothetical protein